MHESWLSARSNCFYVYIFYLNPWHPGTDWILSYSRKRAAKAEFSSFLSTNKRCFCWFIVYFTSALKCGASELYFNCKWKKHSLLASVGWTPAFQERLRGEGSFAFLLRNPGEDREHGGTRWWSGQTGFSVGRRACWLGRRGRLPGTAPWLHG